MCARESLLAGVLRADAIGSQRDQGGKRAKQNGETARRSASTHVSTHRRLPSVACLCSEATLARPRLLAAFAAAASLLPPKALGRPPDALRSTPGPLGYPA